MNITKITTENTAKYDPYLVETLVNTGSTQKVKTLKPTQKPDWESEVLRQGLEKLENSIQQNDDTSPLSYDKAPSVETMQDAQRVLSEINTEDLVRNVNNIFAGLNSERISTLFLEEADVLV